MSEQNNGGRDGYYDLLDSYSGLSDTRRNQSASSSQSRASGNVSFQNSPSANKSYYDSDPYARRTDRDPSAPARRSVQDRPVGERPAGERPVSRGNGTQRPASRPQNSSSARRPASASSGKKLTKKQKRRRRRIKDATQSLLVVFIVIIVVVLASLMLKAPIMGCIGDLVGIDRSANELRVNIEDGMQVDDIIDLLKEKDLIYSARFCKLATDFVTKYDKHKKYTAGTYDLSPNMGIETMLNTIISAGETENTVTLMFPEGLTVDQIVDKLAENSVCAAEKLYNAMNDEELFKNYSFLGEIKDSTGRVRMLEGYLEPDTYEFYIGEDPKSVLQKFLDNFKNKWESEYTEKANELGLTVDQVVTIASILEKEANDADQMKVIASILYNRRNSPSFVYINCDSTQTYVESFRDKVDAATLEAISANYDTYKVTGLPKGAICNPGVDAIEAALYPDSTDYYYFLHDSKGNMYVARTESEHNYNISQYLNH